MYWQKAPAFTRKKFVPGALIGFVGVSFGF
jgi:hypothetical protein